MIRRRCATTRPHLWKPNLRIISASKMQEIVDVESVDHRGVGFSCRHQVHEWLREKRKRREPSSPEAVPEIAIVHGGAKPLR